MATFIQNGDAIDYTPAEDKAAGAVVAFGAGVGVVKEPIKAGELGALALTGVYEFPKASGAIDFGAAVYLTTGGEITASATGNTAAGYAVAAAASGDGAIRVRIG